MNEAPVPELLRISINVHAGKEFLRKKSNLMNHLAGMIMVFQGFLIVMKVGRINYQSYEIIKTSEINLLSRMIVILLCCYSKPL